MLGFHFASQHLLGCHLARPFSILNTFGEQNQMKYRLTRHNSTLIALREPLFAREVRFQQRIARQAESRQGITRQGQKESRRRSWQRVCMAHGAATPNPRSPCPQARACSRRGSPPGATVCPARRDSGSRTCCNADNSLSLPFRPASVHPANQPREHDES